mgnify:CR=1 FL=1
MTIKQIGDFCLVLFCFSVAIISILGLIGYKKKDLCVKILYRSGTFCAGVFFICKLCHIISRL